MNDYTMKAEAGKFTLTGGDATMKVHIPLPSDHPLNSLIGQVATKWALVENFLDHAIWILAKVDDKTGACLTGQILGSFGRLTAIYALCVHRGVDEKIILQLKEMTKNMKGSQDRRNRILHDAWYVEGDTSEQFKSMARDEFLFGFEPVDEAFLKETLEKMERRLVEVGAFLGNIAELRL